MFISLKPYVLQCHFPSGKPPDECTAIGQIIFRYDAPRPDNFSDDMSDEDREAEIARLNAIVIDDRPACALVRMNATGEYRAFTKGRYMLEAFAGVCNNWKGEPQYFHYPAIILDQEWVKGALLEATERMSKPESETNQYKAVTIDSDSAQVLRLYGAGNLSNGCRLAADLVDMCGLAPIDIAYGKDGVNMTRLGLTSKAVNTLKEYGNGNLSLGIRRAATLVKLCN